MLTRRRARSFAGRSGLLSVGASLALLLQTVPAHAAVTPVPGDSGGATTIANAIAADPSQISSANFLAVPPTGTPNGVSNSPLSFFPTEGASFGILSTGNVSLAPTANTANNSGASAGGSNVRGNTDFDVSILKLGLTVPAGANCVTFKFAFYSEEFPEYVGSVYNDAFIAELDTSDWSTAGSSITAPHNFAFDALGNVISINAAGAATMSAANAAGTTYDGATPLLSAATPVTPGPHTLYLSIFDQGDPVYDSAVFLDGLTIGFVPNPAVNCVPGAQLVSYQMALTPATATNEVGTSHTVTAALEDSAGDPVAGASVSFVVTGVNPTSGSATTNAGGQATFTYTGTAAGNDTIAATYDADANGVFEASASATKTWVVTNHAPDCSKATVDTTKLWPPNHQLRSITISGVTDADPTNTVSINVTSVTQDEPTNGLGDGDTPVDAVITPNSNVVKLRAERSGTGDGRVYVINFTATDNHGATCTGTATVTVPHDQKPGNVAVNSGQTFNSTL